MSSEADILGPKLFRTVQLYRERRAIELASWCQETQVASMNCQDETCPFYPYDEMNRAIAASRLLHLIFAEEYAYDVDPHELMHNCGYDMMANRIHVHPRAAAVLAEVAGVEVSA